MELIIVMAIIGILSAIAIPRFRQAPMKAKEAVLKTNLHVMRESFDQYFADKNYYPESLEELVEEGYIRKVPIDPFTQSSSTWYFIYAEPSDDDLPSEDTASQGIFDVKSGSNYISLKGQPVSDW